MPPSRLGEGVVRRVLRRVPLILALLFVAAPAAAATASTTGPTLIVKVHQASGLISPYFQLSGSPGKIVRAGNLELVNPTSSRVSVRLDPVDAITTSTLGSAYSLANAGTHGPTTWLRVSQRNVVLAPHRSERVSVSLAVPISAVPGDYLTGVSVEALGQSQTTNVTRGLAIGEIDRYAIGVELQLPGARHPALTLTGATITREPRGLAFLVGASNPGNVILKNVHGWVRVTDGHRVVRVATIQPGTFVSGTRISYPLLAPREQPAPGASYRVRAALHFAGGTARLDTTVNFSHAAAVTQQNYGGRKLPQSTPPWGSIALALAGLLVLAGVLLLLRRRRRPLSRAAGIKLLERLLSSTDDLPVSIVVITAERSAISRIATALRPRLRRTDRVCELGGEELLLICPVTSRAAATAFRNDIYQHFARCRELADLPIDIALATAGKPSTATKLLERVKESRRRQEQALAGARDERTANAHE
ncbi:MAG: hypothetical protein ACXVHJ_25410 [Solirubrobacteraceae bacterium]